MSDSKPQILFLAHRVPYPPNRGDRIRSYHLIRFLAERADVHLAFLTDDDVPDETRRALDQVCKRVTHARLHPRGRWLHGAQSMAMGRSATQGLFYSGELRRTIANWTTETSFDAVFVFCSSMVQYLETERLRRVPTVVDLVDVDSQKWFDYADKSWGPRRWLLRLEGQRLRQLEGSLPDQVDAITVVTRQEADLFQSFRENYRPRVLRNGVDLEYFRPEPVSTGSKVQSPHSAVFIGALDYQANVDGAAWFCSEVWPEVRKRHPDAQFRLVGSRPSAKAIRLGEFPGVDVVGEVPDVRPYLHNATIVTVPLRVARGIQNKVLEALAVGKPVIVSPQGLEGIDAEPGQDLLAATTATEWVKTIAELFESPERCRELGSGGRAFVERDYRWSSQLETLSSLPALDCLHGDRVRAASENSNRKRLSGTAQ